MINNMEKLQFITHFTERYSYVDSARMALKGGCRWIQLRMKDATEKELESAALQVKDLCGTANTFEDICRLAEQGADYIGCGPFRFTSTKKNLATILGLEGYERLIGQMREKGIDLPLIAIGGIMYDDIPDLWEKGVSGIALSGSVLRAENPVSEMKRIVNRINQTEKTI